MQEDPLPGSPLALRQHGTRPFSSKSALRALSPISSKSRGDPIGARSSGRSHGRTVRRALLAPGPRGQGPPKALGDAGPPSSPTPAHRVGGGIWNCMRCPHPGGHGPGHSDCAAGSRRHGESARTDGGGRHPPWDSGNTQEHQRREAGDPDCVNRSKEAGWGALRKNRGPSGSDPGQGTW